MQFDSTARLGVYEATVDQIVARIRELLEDRVRSRLVWVSIKAVYSGLITDHDDCEIAETFFNSITRRIFDTVGVDEEIEFVHSDYERPPSPASRPAYRTFEGWDSLADALAAVLQNSGLPLDNEKCQRQSLAANAYIEAQPGYVSFSGDLRRLDVIEAVFYRGEYAYLIGRLVERGAISPLVLCLNHADAGVCIDAVLLNESEVSLLFSFARSYFHVDTDRPFEIVQFIKSIIPPKAAVGNLQFNRIQEARQDGTLSTCPSSSGRLQRQI